MLMTMLMRRYRQNWNKWFVGCCSVLFLPSSLRLVAVFQLYSVKRHRPREYNDDVSINMHLSSFIPREFSLAE